MNLFPSFCGVLLHSRLLFASSRQRSLDEVRIGTAVFWSIHPGHSQAMESRDKKQSYVWLALFLQYLTHVDAYMAYQMKLWKKRLTRTQGLTYTNSFIHRHRDYACLALDFLWCGVGQGRFTDEQPSFQGCQKPPSGHDLFYYLHLQHYLPDH